MPSQSPPQLHWPALHGYSQQYCAVSSLQPCTRAACTLPRLILHTLQVTLAHVMQQVASLYPSLESLAKVW